MALNASQALNQLKVVLTSFRAFAERVSRDPVGHLAGRAPAVERPAQPLRPLGRCSAC